MYSIVKWHIIKPWYYLIPLKVTAGLLPHSTRLVGGWCLTSASGWWPPRKFPTWLWLCFFLAFSEEIAYGHNSAEEPPSQSEGSAGSFMAAS